MKLKFFFHKQLHDVRTYGKKELLRKFYLTFIVIIKNLNTLIGIIPALIIRLLSLFVIVRIDRFPCGNFGDLAEIPAIYLCKKKLKIDLPKKNYIDLFYIHSNDKKIANKQLIKMWKRNFNFFPSYILDPIYRAGKFIPGWKRHSIELMSYRREHDVDNLIEEYTPLSFTKEEEVYGKNMLAEFGIKGKFICLAVRDEEYQKKKIASRFRDWSYHEYRNHDVDNFILASEELVRRGYHVIRMGVVVKKSINSNNPKIIDYANSSLRSDFMDVYLGAKCSFCISTGFGFDFVPYIFKKPVLRMCLPVGDIQSYSKKFLTVTNNHVTKKDQRKLSMSEIFSKGLGYAYDTKIYREKGVELIDFTPEEIKEMAVEMLETYELKNVSDQESKKLQNAFNSIFASNIKHYDHRKGSKDAIWKLHGEIRSLFSAKFLSKNKHWLK